MDLLAAANILKSSKRGSKSFSQGLNFSFFTIIYHNWFVQLTLSP
jgi:hypothetical protein